jgi:hypothetical protein
MSYDPYPSYQAPPPPPHRPPADPFPPFGRQPSPDGARHGPGQGRGAQRYPAHDERFPAYGRPLSAAERVRAGDPVPVYEDVFPDPDPGPAAGPSGETLALRPVTARQSDELAPLRAAYARQRRVAGATVFGFFALYVLLTVYVPSVSNAGPGDGPSLGLVLGLLQLPVTVGALIVHERTALRRVDPLVDRARARMEEGR